MTVHLNGVALPSESARTVMRALQTDKHRYIRTQTNASKSPGARRAAEKKIAELDALTALLSYATGEPNPTPDKHQRRRRIRVSRVIE